MHCKERISLLRIRFDCTVADMDGTNYTRGSFDDVSFSMAAEHVTKSFRFPADLAEDLTARAQRERLSLNAYVVHALLAHVGQGDDPLKLAPPAEEPAAGAMRLDPDLTIGAADRAALATFGTVRFRPVSDLRGIGTAPMAWDDFAESLARRTSCDAQLVLYGPADPETPIFVAVECLWADGCAYLMFRRVWSGGQWCRRRSLTFEVPAALRSPAPAALRAAEDP
jgi:hypothetical protein